MDTWPLSSHLLIVISFFTSIVSPTVYVLPLIVTVSSAALAIKDTDITDTNIAIVRTIERHFFNPFFKTITSVLFLVISIQNKKYTFYLLHYISETAALSIKISGLI